MLVFYIYELLSLSSLILHFIESRPTQVLNTSRHPINLQYSPDAKTIMVLDDDDRLSFIKHGHTGPEGQLEWKAGDPVKINGQSPVTFPKKVCVA